MYPLGKFMSGAGQKRAIPSIDELLNEGLFRTIEEAAGRRAALRIARASVEEYRNGAAGRSNGLTRGEAAAAIIEAAAGRFRLEQLSGVRRVINATGVVIHTNLGRSPLPAEAANAVIEHASRYCTLEYDRTTGSRGRRGARAEALISELAGAESAAIVNNCAAAAFLVLRVLAKGKEVIISRGELVEIGGDFRIPDVLAESGAELREVGTTNRTKLSDYARAINERTGLILRVHPSNFRIVGFHESPSAAALAELAHSHSIPFFEDAGSGALTSLYHLGLADEQVISESIEAGVDIVSFSGDKLLGGVQAGFIVGRTELIDRVRRHQLYRALRVDKLTYAAIEATLDIYRRDRQFEEIPTLMMLSAAAEDIRARAVDLIGEIRGRVPGNVTFDILSGESAVGGGAGAAVALPTFLIAIGCATEPDVLEKRLRERELPVIARILDGRVVIDLRTVFADETGPLADALVNALTDG